MRGGKNKYPPGYTIVEVLIVLAVSGVMFVMAALFINGKQATTAFNVGVNQMVAEIQAVVSQVISGQYSDVSFGCTVSFGTVSISTLGATGTGTHDQCIFVGKMIQLTNPAPTNFTQYRVVPMAASSSATDLSKTAPVWGNGVDLTTLRNLPQGLTATKVVATTPLGAVIGGNPAIGVVTSMDTTPATVTSGSPTVGLVYLSGAWGAGNSNLSLQPAQSASICVTDGQRYAKIQIGTSSLATAGSGQLSVTRQIVSIC